MKTKRKWWRLPLIFATILMILFPAIRLCKGLWVRSLVNHVLEQEQMVLSLHMESPMEYDDASISWDTTGENRIITLDLGQESLYLRKNDLYFSNGTGYSLDGLFGELPVNGDQLRKLLAYLPWERIPDANFTSWKLAIPEEPGFLIRRLVPDAEQYWTQLRSLEIYLDEVSGNLKSIRIQYDTFYGYLELQNAPPQPIPTDLLMQMGTAPLPDIRMLEPLVRACISLNQADSVPGELNIQVDCGPLPIQDTARILLSEEGLSLSRGDRWTALTPDSFKREQILLGFGWYLLREGVWTPVQQEGRTMVLTLKAEDLRSSLLSILPELEGLNLTMNDGELTIRIIDNRFDTIELTCSGELPFLFAQIPLSIRLELSISE